MITINRIGVSNSLFKRQVFTFKPGVSYIYGLNKSDQFKGKNANAVGKSYFFSSLGEMLFDQPIVGLKIDKAKEGSRFLEFTKGKNEYKIQSSFKGKKEHFQIFKNGEDMGFRTTKNGKEAMAKLLPLNNEEFSTYVHIDSQVPHPLVRGNFQARKSFFTSFFNLDQIDSERKILQAELALINKDKARLVEVQKSFDDLKKDLLPKSKRLSLEAELETLQKKLNKAIKGNEEVQEVQRVLGFEMSVGKELREFRRITTVENFEADFEKFKARLSRFADSIQDAKSYLHYLELKAEYDKKKKEVGDFDLKDLNKAFEKFEELNPKFQLLRSKLDDLKKVGKPKKVEKPLQDRDDLVAKRSRLKDDLSHAKEFKKGKCPTCGSSVKAHDPSVIEKELAKVNKLIENADEYEQYKIEHKEYKAYVETKEELESSIEKLKPEIRQLKLKVKKLELVRELKKPLKVDEPKFSVEELIEKQEKLESVIQTLKFFKPHVDTLRVLESITDEQKEKAREYNPTLAISLQEKISEIKAKLELHAAVKGKAMKLKKRIEKLQVMTENEEALKLLVKGYSDKAIKKMAVEAISQYLMEHVNKYAAQVSVFHGFQFSFVWTSTQISLLAHRPNGDVSDVRKLSGAESKLFTMILVLSLLAFVPSKRRCNILILDEPTASMHRASTEAFHELLGVMNQMIPSIVIITPKTEERYPDAHEYTVIRDSSGARIEEGLLNQ